MKNLVALTILLIPVLSSARASSNEIDRDRGCSYEMQKETADGVLYLGKIHIRGFLSDSDPDFRSNFCSELLPLLITPYANLKGDVRFRDGKSRYEVICQYRSDNDYAYNKSQNVFFSPASLKASQNNPGALIERSIDIQCQALAS